jgi:hypothetical protein
MENVTPHTPVIGRNLHDVEESGEHQWPVKQEQGCMQSSRRWEKQRVEGTRA